MDGALVRYMLTHVRMNSIVDPERWTDKQVAEAFLMLPPPKVSFEVWNELSGASSGPDPKELARYNEGQLNVLEMNTQDKSWIKVS